MRDFFDGKVSCEQGGADRAIAEGRAGSVLAGTLILTDIGPFPVESLSTDAMVLTRDCGYQPIRRCEAVWVDHQSVLSIPRAFFADAAPGVVRVAPSQLLLVDRAMDDCGQSNDERLVQAGDFIGWPGVRTAKVAAAYDYLLDFEEPQLFWADGQWCGSRRRLPLTETGRLCTDAAHDRTAIHQTLHASGSRGRAA